MIGKGVLEERFQPRTCSGKRIPKTGQGKGHCKNVVLIDVDVDQVDDVVIIDLPEYGQQKLHCSSVESRDRKCPPQCVISIDDDESNDADHPGTIAESGGELDSDASSSKRFPPAQGCMRNSVHINIDDCHVHEKGTPSNLPKCRQTCSAKTADRNRYGLDASESELSESDCSDCEVIEVCEQWEKASVKRKRRGFNDQAGFDEHASSSGLHSNFYADIEVENSAGQHVGSPICSGPSNGKYAKDNLSDSDDNQIDDFNLTMGQGNPCKDSFQKVVQESNKVFRPGSSEKMQSLHQSSESDSQCGERTWSEKFSKLKKEAGDKEAKFMSSSQESKRQNENDGSSLRNNDVYFSEVHSSSASFDVRHLNLDGPVCVRDIINEREKLKETDEYKQAIEEEWASRQRQLQIQVLHICHYVDDLFLIIYVYIIFLGASNQNSVVLEAGRGASWCKCLSPH